MKYEIRELGVSAILDQAIKLIQDNFKLLFGIVLVILVPYTLVQGLVAVSVTPTLPANATPEMQAAAIRAALSSQMILLPLVLGLVYVVIPITNAALVHAIARAYLQQPTSVMQALKFALQRILPLIWTWFLMGLAIMGGLLLCVVPGILAALWFGLATQVVILEGISGFDALKRSKLLMTGNIGKLFLLGLVVGLINLAAGAVSAFIPQPHVQAVLGSVIQGLATIFSSATTVIFYFSTRCKAENFDLTLLAESVAAAEAPPVATEPGAA